MPELPEVETIVRSLNKKVKGLKITNVWVDRKSIVKKTTYADFVKKIKGRTILEAKRRAKYILIKLSKGKTLIIHQKMSGHLLYGKWKVKGNKVKALTSGPISKDSQNRFIRLIFYLNNKKQLALSDLRRFAKVLLVNTEKVKGLKEIKKLGPEPLKKDFTFLVFKESIQKTNRKIKQVLMDQTIIAGIGNIYSDEILFDARIYPLRKVNELNEDELKRIYNSIKKILNKAIKLQGDSMSDYRTIEGGKGKYQKVQRVYQREGKKCYRCKGTIKRIKIGGRSAHFCPSCQK